VFRAAAPAARPRAARSRPGHRSRESVLVADDKDAALRQGARWWVPWPSRSPWPRLCSPAPLRRSPKAGGRASYAPGRIGPGSLGGRRR